MSGSQELQLAKEFTSPPTKARLTVLLSLASAVGAHLHRLYEESEQSRRQSGGSQLEWQQILAVLAKVFETQIGSVTKAADALALWKSFLADNRIKSAPQGRGSALGRIGAALAASLATSGLKVAHLTVANRQAAAFLQQSLARYHLAPAAGIAPVPLFVSHDPEAREFCASASPLQGSIRWSFQLKSFSFYGALIPQLIFEHEYLSHLLPRSPRLSRPVREIWLMQALRESHHQTSTANAGWHVDSVLFEKFRYELVHHFAGSEEQLFGPSRLDLLATRIHALLPAAFWAITGAILNLPEDGDAERVDGLLGKLEPLSRGDLQSALSQPWKRLEDLDKSI